MRKIFRWRARTKGPKYSPWRPKLAEFKCRLKQADAQAGKNGLTGNARYAFICARTGYRDSGDFRRLRQLLEDPSRKQQKDKDQS